jgi:hypothetical protein
MMVSRKCNVEFKIRGYTNEIMCDVIPMDIFHFFSGIQWQYNINVIHDGQKNTYTLEKSGHTHMLFPMEDTKLKEEVIPSILLMSGKELLNEVKKEQEM